MIPQKQTKKFWSELVKMDLIARHDARRYQKTDWST